MAKLTFAERRELYNQGKGRSCPSLTWVLKLMADVTNSQASNAELLKQRISRDFTYHAPKEGQILRYESIRDKARELAYLMADTCPYSRELSVALTHLEEAVMWANAAIARNE